MFSTHQSYMFEFNCYSVIQKQFSDLHKIKPKKDRVRELLREKSY